MKGAPGLLTTAMVCAAAVTAQFVSGKATRDALFLTSMDFTALPAMLIATAICSIVLIALHATAARRFVPATLVPALFAGSGLLFLGEWALRTTSPATAAIVIYLHISGLGPLLASGFWLIASERFDPRTAKKRFGQIAGAGTLGGLLSALVAERIASLFGAPAMLPFLAMLQFLCAWLVWRLAAGLAAGRTMASDAAHDAALPLRSGLRIVAETPYLRHLAILVLLGTTSAALVDYLFKAQAVATYGRGDNILRFFAIYYAATSCLTFVLQITSSRVTLERFGLAATTSTPSWAVLLGSLGGLLVPGFGSLLIARGGESVFRSSFFRAGYELFYTPIAAADKRAAKSVIDVGFDRLGDALGGGLIRLAILVLPAAGSTAILSLAIAASAGALWAASRLNHGYIGSLASSLVNWPVDTDGPVPGDSNRNLVRSAFTPGRAMRPATSDARGIAREAAEISSARPGLDADLEDILSLRSRKRDRVVMVLSRSEGLTPVLIPHVLPLLSWDAVAEHAVFALRKVAEEHVGALTDALIDPNHEFALRRRLARVFSVCVSQRAVDGLLLALDDVRFDVRCQAARSLTEIQEKNPRVHIDREQIFEVVLREAAVGRPVWESRRLLDGFVSESPLDAFVRDRAGESLAHVFRLLALVLPREPLQIAFRGLHTDDPYLQGTALEYLEGVLPVRVRQRLWPFIEMRPGSRRIRPSEEVIADLLRSNHSILLNLKELRRQTAAVAVESKV